MLSLHRLAAAAAIVSIVGAGAFIASPRPAAAGVCHVVDFPDWSRQATVTIPGLTPQTVNWFPYATFVTSAHSIIGIANTGYSGISLFMSVHAIHGTPSLIATILAQPTPNDVVIMAQSSTITGPGAFFIAMRPGITPVTGWFVSQYMPATFGVQISITGGSMDIASSYDLLL
jgi:hypothetical protein